MCLLVLIPIEKLFDICVSDRVCVSTRYMCRHVRVISLNRGSEARCNLRSWHMFFSSCHSGSGLWKGVRWVQVWKTSLNLPRPSVFLNNCRAKEFVLTRDETWLPHAANAPGVGYKSLIHVFTEVVCVQKLSCAFYFKLNTLNTFTCSPAFLCGNATPEVNRKATLIHPNKFELVMDAVFSHYLCIDCSVFFSQTTV